MIKHIVSETLPVVINCGNVIFLSDLHKQLFGKQGLDKLLNCLLLSGVAY
jgi:hypothetical protein